jgi:type IV pilus assembly protein PilM
MAKRKKPLVGLDIDPVGIHAAQVTTSGSRIVVERAAVATLEPGVVRDGEIQDVDALAEALKTLYRENKGLDRRVRVGVANQKLAVRTVDLPIIEDRKELDAAVRFQAQDVIPMPLDQAVLDWQPLAVVETPEGPRQRVLLVAARKDMVDRVVAAVRAAGLRLDGIDLGAFAMIRALHEGADEPETVLYAAVGGITNLAVARGTQPLFSRASGGGLEAIAVELAERRSLTLEHARGWLQHVGLSAPVESLEGDAEIIADARHVLEEGVRKIGAEVRQTLDFHQMQVDGAPVSRVVLTGEAIAVAGFADHLGIELGLPVTAGRVSGEPDGITAGRMTVAAGLAAGGDPSVNVLPPEERRAAGTAGRSEGAVYAVLGVMALALVLLTVSVLAKNGVADKETKLAKVESEANGTEQVAKSLASYTEFAALREKRVETVRQIAGSRFDWAHALGEVSRTIPKDAWLVSLTGTVTAEGSGGGGTLRGAIPQPAISVIGCTTSQAAVARVMANLRRIDGVERVSLESSEKLTGESGGATGGTGGEKGGSKTDCRNGNKFVPKFEITAWFTAPPALAPAATGTPGATENASTTATGPGTTEGSGVASDPASQSPDSSGTAPGAAPASNTSTPAGGDS